MNGVPPAVPVVNGVPPAVSVVHGVLVAAHRSQPRAIRNRSIPEEPRAEVPRQP